jgi:hypothetical protein
MHKDKKFCFNYCQYKKKRMKRNEIEDKTKKKCEELLKKNMSKAHTYKCILVHSLLPVAYNVP